MPDLIEDNRIVQSDVQTLGDVGFISGTKAFLSIGPLNGNKPVLTQMSSIVSLFDDIYIYIIYYS